MKNILTKLDNVLAENAQQEMSIAESGPIIVKRHKLLKKACHKYWKGQIKRGVWHYIHTDDTRSYASTSYSDKAVTFFHNFFFIETVVLILRFFLMLSMMPLERCVATENDFIALLRNKDLEQICDVNRSCALTLCLLNSGRFHLLPLDVSARQISQIK